MTTDLDGLYGLGELDGPLKATLDGLEAARAVSRLWNHDHTLWSPEPTEIVDRLGWLDVLDDMEAQRGRIDDFVARLNREGFTHCVLMGMGGSSLFPEVIARSFPTGPSGLELRVLDTTDPVAVARTSATVPHPHTLFLAASKSGGTIETRSHLEYFWDLVGDPNRFAVITDPGSDLAALAHDRGFREVFENRTDIGGRFSALSLFGLVPAALAGVDWFALVERARDRTEALRSDDPTVNPGLWLGAVMASAVTAGRDKLTLVLDPRAPMELLPTLATLSAPRNLRLMIGPEGGFSPKELEALRGAGAIPVALRGHVLRIETAAELGAGLILQSVRSEG